MRTVSETITPTNRVPSVVSPEKTAIIESRQAICSSCRFKDRFTRITVVCKKVNGDCTTCSSHINLINGSCPIRKWASLPIAPQPIRTVTESQPVGESLKHTSTEVKVDLASVVTLARRADRAAAFIKQVREMNWPLPEPEIFRAIDDHLVPPPPWFKAGRGAWGCYRSHLAIIERALNERLGVVALFEDDALFIDGFAERYRVFMNALPGDWEMAYLGGQHWKVGERKPVIINEHIVRPYNVNRTHAYLLRGDGIRKAYVHLNKVGEWMSNPSHHIDHRYGALHESGGIKVYAPSQWLVGQRAGYSNIAGKEMPAKFFNHAQVAVVPVTVVLGVWKGGTSIVAGILNSLGVQMGEVFAQTNPGYETMEDSAMFKILHKYIPEKWLASAGGIMPEIDREALTAAMKAWFTSRDRRVETGVKHPLLCHVIPELVKALDGQVRFIVVKRDWQASAASLKKSAWWGSPSTVDYDNLVGRTIVARDNGLVSVPSVPTLVVEYEKLIADPRPVVEEIAKFVDASGDIEEAVTLVNPGMNHHGP